MILGDSDLLLDIAERLVKAGLDSSVVRNVMQSARKKWGGERHYILAIDRNDRNTLINNSISSGISLRRTAQCLGCSFSTVRRVVINSKPKAMVRF